MKQLSLILTVLACVLGIMPTGAAQAAPPNASPDAVPAGVPVDLENARKAKALLDQAIQALGGTAYLEARDLQQAGRTYSFHHGQPTSNGIQFWRFTQYPDRERIELTKERDVAQLYVGNKGWEITYKGAHPIEDKDLSEYLRRRRFSLDTLLKTWVNDSKVALFYDGEAVAVQRPALKVTLINSSNESVSLYVDAETHLPLKKTFSWRDPIDKQKNLEEETYDNYRPVQGIMTPYGFTRYFNGDMAGERFLNSASYNQGLDQAMFDPNSGYNPNKPAKK
jgi:hypothetical protein